MDTRYEFGNLMVIAGRRHRDMPKMKIDVELGIFDPERAIEIKGNLDESASIGSEQVEAVFENGRAAFGVLGERGVPAEILAERAGRRLLRFIEEETGCVDPWLADQLAVPLALARGGGRVTTPEVTSHLETVATVLRRFGVEAATWGRPGGPGGLEVPRW